MALWQSWDDTLGEDPAALTDAEFGIERLSIKEIKLEQLAAVMSVLMGKDGQDRPNWLRDNSLSLP